MAAGVDVTTFSNYLKRRYVSSWMKAMTYMDNRALSMIAKNERLTGTSLHIPTVYADIQAGSATFSTAQSAADSTTTGGIGVVQWALTRVTDYSLGRVTNEALLASEGNEAAFLDAKTAVMDSVMRTAARSANISIFRSGYGAIGRIANSIGASAVITLGTSTGGNVAGDVANFEVGMKLQFAASEAGAALRDSGATLTVTGVDRSAGTVTVNANLNTISGLAQNDFIFRSGDREDSATPSRTKLSGFQAWVPDSAPSSTAFFGVDRSVDTRLGGSRKDVSAGVSLEEGLLDLVTESVNMGGKVKSIFINPRQYNKLRKEMQARGSLDLTDVKAQAGVGFRTIMVMGDSGEVAIVSDVDCQQNKAWAVDMGHFTLGTLGGVPRLLLNGPLALFPVYNQDAWEVRIGYYGNMYTDAPGYQVNGTLAL
jgi:hypothetical protein